MPDSTGRGSRRLVTTVKTVAMSVAIVSSTAAAVTGSGADLRESTNTSSVGLPASATATALDAGRPEREESGRTAAMATGEIPGTSGPVRETREHAPDRVVLSDDRGIVAVFTAGARTVVTRGAQRTFQESTTSATVTTTSHVWLLPEPFGGVVDYAWLVAVITDPGEDLLEVARQYLTGAPDRTDATGGRIAGDASYGPLLADGTRQEGSDFNDFLGVPWSYRATVDPPETHQWGSLDSSGYVRAVFGHRSKLEMTAEPDGVRLPRRAVQMASSAPGVMVLPDSGQRPHDLSRLLPGDLVFFDVSADDGTLVDHVGIYLGTDSAGAPRFVSSRKGADGPTMGDVRGRSTLSGAGLYASAFRAARRL